MNLTTARNRGILLTSSQAKPFRTQHKAPCSDCPWARKSLKGWTGPNTTRGWLALARDYWHPIACHTRRIAREITGRYAKPEVNRVSRECNGHWECAGGAIYRANTSVMPFPERNHLQLPANKITVFASPAEMLAHHGEGIEL